MVQCMYGLSNSFGSTPISIMIFTSHHLHDLAIFKHMRNYFWIFICITYYCISWNFQVRASYYCRITSFISSTPATHSKVPQAWCIARWSSSMILIGIYFLFKIVDKFVGLKNVWRCSSAMKLNNKYACILTSESILFVIKKLMIHTLCGKSLVYV